jgi:hypothetical protein
VRWAISLPFTPCAASGFSFPSFKLSFAFDQRLSLLILFLAFVVIVIVAVILLLKLRV